MRSPRKIQHLHGPRGTEVAALFYSLIGTCRMLDVNPTEYLLAAATVAIESPGEVLLPHEF
ncbi:MAG: transposase domain-containing protein, partial [Deltaproteobacteria bacterium]|nr:transposase domain-containing protein [Deltaproteobacteria bacterium]